MLSRSGVLHRHRVAAMPMTFNVGDSISLCNNCFPYLILELVMAYVFSAVLLTNEDTLK